MNIHELKEKLSEESDGFKLGVTIETTDCVSISDVIIQECIEVCYYYDYMVESDLVHIRAEDFKRFLSELGYIGKELSYDDFMEIYDDGLTLRVFVKEFIDNWLNLQ